MRSTPANRVLFVSHTAELGDAELSLLDVAIGHRERGAVALFSDGPLAAALVSHNVAVIPISAGMTGPSSLRAAYALSRAAVPFGLLYANSPASFLVSAAAGLFADRRVVWHLRDILDTEHFNVFHIRLLIALANRRAGRVVANAQSVADAFVAAGGRRELTRVVYDGIDVQPFDRLGPQARADVRRTIGISDHDFVVGVVAERGDEAAQRLVRNSIEMLPGAHALVIDRARRETPRLIAACDVVVHVSSASDVSARALVEPLIGRRPVVAGAIGVAREIVESGETGILVPPGDANALTETLRRLRDDPVRRDEIAFAGHADARRRFSRQSMNASITRVLDDVLSGASAIPLP
ncbi:MAG: glycosyltransferase [bacterium]